MLKLFYQVSDNSTVQFTFSLVSPVLALFIVTSGVRLVVIAEICFLINHCVVNILVKQTGICLRDFSKDQKVMNFRLVFIRFFTTLSKQNCPIRIVQSELSNLNFEEY